MPVRIPITPMLPMDIRQSKLPAPKLTIPKRATGARLPLKESKLPRPRLEKYPNSTILPCRQGNQHSKKPPNSKQRKR